jgi:hypothetical protein
MMLRDQLIRRLFEAARDRRWEGEMEPKFRRHGVKEERLSDYRDAWNRQAERGWARWQAEAERYSTDDLDRLLAYPDEKINAVVNVVNRPDH